MQVKNIQDIVCKLAEPIVETAGYELVDVEFIKEGVNWYLRIFIDNETGVNLDDCESVSRLLSDLLDQKDPIRHSYFLEVSSPGIERSLRKEKDFKKYLGSLVNIHTYTNIEGKKLLHGKLGEVTQEILILHLLDNNTLKIQRDNIARVKLAWEKSGNNKEGFRKK